MFRTITQHEETALGLPYAVILENAAQEILDDDGSVLGVHIPNMENLVATIAAVRCLMPERLRGNEVRFIRKVIGKGAKEFAEDLEMDPSTYSRWENEKQTVGGWADKQVRQMTILLLAGRIAHLKIDPNIVVSLRFQGDIMNRVPLHFRLEKCGNQDGDAWVDLPLAA